MGERLAQAYDIYIGLLCAEGGGKGLFNKPLSEWDRERLEFLSTWQPEHVVWLDFWAGDSRAPFWFTGYEFDYAFQLLTKHAPKVTVFGDSPTLPILKLPGDAIFKEYVRNRYSKEGNFDFLLELEEDQDYRTRRIAIEGNIT